MYIYLIFKTNTTLKKQKYFLFFYLKRESFNILPECRTVKYMLEVPLLQIHVIASISIIHWHWLRSKKEKGEEKGMRDVVKKCSKFIYCLWSIWRFIISSVLVLIRCLGEYQGKNCYFLDDLELNLN